MDKAIVRLALCRAVAIGIEMQRGEVGPLTAGAAVDRLLQAIENNSAAGVLAAGEREQ